MGLSQIFVKALLESALFVLQRPPIDDGLFKSLKIQIDVESVDVGKQDENDRNQVLASLSQAQTVEAAEACNVLPEFKESCRKLQPRSSSERRYGKPDVGSTLTFLRGRRYLETKDEG